MTLRNDCRLKFADVMALMVILPLLAAGCWGYGGRSRETANRVKCASNLKQIGQAMLLYANENGGHYPQTIAGTGPNVVPVWGTGVAASDPFKEGGPKTSDVSAAMFLLLRTQDITSEVFICPSSNGERDTFGDGMNTALNRSNFTKVPLNLSYSMQNPYPSDGVLTDKEKETWWTSAMGPEFALAADMNPGLTGNNDNVTAPSAASPSKDLKQANSNNHDEDGQNVLYADGHVEWHQNPFVGINRDNIFTRAKSPTATADAAAAGGNSDAVSPFGSPLDANDNVLLPTDD